MTERAEQPDRSPAEQLSADRGPENPIGPTSGPRPRLLLDIDGVINALPRRLRAPGYTRHHILGYPIHLHHQIADMVGRLAEDFEVSWFTTWDELAAPHMGPHVGLTDIDRIPTSAERGWALMHEQGYDDDATQQVFFAKTPLLAEALDPAARWVWIDDMIGPADQSYLEDRGFDPSRFLLLRTDPRTGLTWDDVAEAMEFGNGGRDEGAT